MDVAQIKQIIKRELPAIMQEDTEIQQFILDLAHDQFADKMETESRFDRLLAELRQDREAQEKKWAENQETMRQDREAQEKKWAENQEAMRQDREAQEKKWEAQEKKWAENQEAIKQLLRKYDSGIGALGARWGIRSEQSFRNALKSILEESFAVEVLNITEFDDEGDVFGQPDQVELDIVIKNGLLIICEIKSSMSRSDMYTFGRKITFYENRHNTKATRTLVISPMVEEYAKRVAKKLGIEIYSYAEDVESL